MTNISDFQRGQIDGARMVGASITKTHGMFGVSTSVVSNVMTAFEKEVNPSEAKQNSRNQKTQTRTVGDLRELFERIQGSKFLQNLMKTSITDLPQKLFNGCCTKPDFTEALQS